MNKDNIRTSLITTFVCAECGENLLLSYDKPNGSFIGSVTGEPTGAAMVKSIIYIKPCETCLEPAKRARQAIKNLMEI